MQTDWQKIADRIQLLRGLARPEAPMRNPFAPPEGVTVPTIRPTFVERGLPRDADGHPIPQVILNQMDRVRTLRDLGQLVTGGQQATANYRASHPQGSRSALWG